MEIFSDILNNPKEKRVLSSINARNVVLLAFLREYVKGLHPKELKLELGLYIVSKIKDNAKFDWNAICKDVFVFNSPYAENLLQSVAQQLEVVLESPDHLCEFITDMSQWFHENEEAESNEFALSYSSFLGLFVRKMMLSFNTLPFDMVGQLFDELREYCQDSIEDQVTVDRAKQDPKYLDWLNQRDYLAAKHSLHKYFDLGTTKTSDSSKHKSLLPYAVLHLAIFHFHHGNLNEALEAIHETIRMAQERNLPDCLTYALAWMSKIANSYQYGFLTKTQNHNYYYPNSREEKIRTLQICISKAQQLHLHSLKAQNQLELSQYYLQHNPTDKGTLPYQVLSSLSATTKVNAATSEIMKFVGTSNIFTGGYWQLFGFNDMTSLYAELQSWSPKPTNNENTIESQSLLFAHIQLACRAADDADYGRAIDLMRESHQYVRADFQDTWLHLCGTFLHEQAMLRGDLQTASILCTQMRDLLSKKTDIRIHLDVRYRHALVCIRRNQLTEASRTLYSLLNLANKYKLRMQSVIFSLSLAELYQSILALSYVLSALSASNNENYRLATLHVIATTLLAEIQLTLGNSSKALSLAIGVYDQTLHHGSQFAIANIHLLLAKCKISCSKVTPELGNEAINLLKKSEATFVKLSAFFKLRELYHLQALIYHTLNNKEERNQASKNFNRINQSIEHGCGQETKTAIHLPHYLSIASLAQ